MPPRRCIANGCRQWATPPSSSCPSHGNRGKARPTGKPMAPGWKARRARHLAIEPDCRVCGEPAVTVDHVRARARGGGDEDENLRSLCARHWRVKDNQDAAQGRRIANAKRKARRRLNFS